MSRDIAYEEVAARLREHLGERETAHSVAVSSVAGDLAATYGVDVEKARLAGLLHDWAREMSDDDLISAASEFGIETTPVDRAVPYLLHAAVGAKLVQSEIPGIGEDVLLSISRHTTGCAEMSDLDKVVYVADMVEPRRSFEGVDELRDSIGALGLDELFMAAYARSLRHLIEKHRRIHPSTVEVWNALVAQEKSQSV